MGVGFRGLGFGVLNPKLGFVVRGSRFWGFFRVWDSGFRVRGLGLWVRGVRLWG